MQSGILKNVAKLLAANIIAQIIGFLVYPILTRLYVPEDFGVLNLFLAIAGVATIFSTAEYQNAILLPQSDKSGAACFHVGLAITLAVGAISALAVPFAEEISALFNVPEITDFIWLLPIYIIIISLWTLLNYWYTRCKRFTAVSSYLLTQCTASAGLKWSFYYVIQNGAMIIGTVCAQAAAVAVSIAANFKSALKPLLSIDRTECRLMARQYANFPKFAMPRAVVNYLSSNLMILLLTPFFSLSDIGFLGMALTLSLTPTLLIIRSVYQVFFQNTAERVQRRESILPFFRQLSLRTILFVAPLFVALYFVLPQLTALILGDGWEASGTYIQAFLPWIFTTIMVGPISYLTDIFAKQKIELILEITTFVLRLASLVAGILANDFFLAILCYSLASCTTRIAQLIWYQHLIGQYEKSIQAGA
ncbi:MAG: oligosaccharide flippase family protein [Bacteroidales bacterium]|nr:oligosaccharide flippase family protein [Bacteroidales bacterium]